MRLYACLLLLVFGALLTFAGLQQAEPSARSANVEAERTLGGLLERPVFQCGTGVDAVTEDGMPGTVTVFEGGPVRPIALSSDGRRLFVANRPAHCLEIYAVEADSLRLISSVAVGLEPVALAERNGNEVWVVNHLSDSVSVVRLDGTPRVLRTLQVGDEPRDIVFAGPNRDRAFITAAWRGQNHPSVNSARLLTPGQGRADVWVYEADRLDDSLNGNPLTILTLFSDTPRGLAVSPDGATVYAAPFYSGNGTTTLHRNAVLNRKPLPGASVDGVRAPDTGLIVKYDGAAWRDEARTDWSGSTKFSLPDYDLFAIDANAAVPALGKRVSGVGTTLFNVAVHPTSGKVYVSNTEARNQVRFEGPGSRASTVRGHSVESRISVVDPVTGAVDPVHLNAHVNFGLPEGDAISDADKARSLSQPTAMLFSPDGATLYVAVQRTSDTQVVDVNVVSGAAGGSTTVGSASTPVQINQLVADATGAIVGGSYRGDVRAAFADAPITPTDTAFVARIRGGSAGRFFTTTSTAQVWSLSRDGMGGYVVGGEFRSALNFEGTTLPGNGSVNIFFGRTTL